MRVVTALNVEEGLSAGVRAGQLRSGLAAVADEAIDTVRQAVSEREQAAHSAAEQGMAEFAGALGDLHAATNGLFNLHSAIGMVQAARSRSDDLEPAVVEVIEELQAINAAGIPEPMLPQDVRDAFHDASGLELDAAAAAQTLLAGAVSGITPDNARQVLASLAFTRLWSLHGQLLATVAAADGQGDSASRAEVKQLRDDLEDRVRALRDAIQSAMSTLHRRNLAGPAWAISVWLALDSAETFIVERFDAMAAAARAAAGPAEAVARDWAVAYDAARTLIALISGTWALLRAHACHDVEVLTRGGTAAALQKAPATPDFARSPLSEVATALQGTPLEIAGVVAHVDTDVGGPAPRSVLRVGPEQGAQVSVLVPFIAVTSFGVQPGVWVQVRGTAFPDGKDDLQGPVVQTSRIRRQEAANASFHDWLIWEGRDQFELRPGGWDLLAGRLPGTDKTAAELGLRR